MSDFRGTRVICNHEETIKAPAAEIFPLACPVEELKWIDGWRYELVYSESGFNETHCIFTEEFSGPVLFDAPVKTTWFTTLHDPEKTRVEFVLTAGDKAIIKLDIHLKDAGDGVTIGQWRFTFTTLNEEAERAIDGKIEEKIMAILTFLGGSIKHYCETGEMLKMS